MKKMPYEKPEIRSEELEPGALGGNLSGGHHHGGGGDHDHDGGCGPHGPNCPFPPF